MGSDSAFGESPDLRITLDGEGAHAYEAFRFAAQQLHAAQTALINAQGRYHETLKRLSQFAAGTVIAPTE